MPLPKFPDISPILQKRNSRIIRATQGNEKESSQHININKPKKNDFSKQKNRRQCAKRKWKNNLQDQIIVSVGFQLGDLRHTSQTYYTSNECGWKR